MKQLRVLQVNTFDIAGGASRAAQRLHLALRARGVDSEMLVMRREVEAPHVWQPYSAARRPVRRLLEAAASHAMRLQRSPGNGVLHSLNLFASGLGHWINARDYDVVHLHWLGGDMLSVGEIGRIRHPVCWTLHDMWPFTGTEHYDDLTHPGRYREAYGPDNRPPGHGGIDLDAWNWRRKQRAWEAQSFQLVAPSAWMARCAAESRLLGRHPCQVIPNALDTEVFRPLDRAEARRALGLDPDRRYILFGSSTGADDRRKGFHLLLDALRQLGRSPQAAAGVELLVFGAPPAATLEALPLPARALGYIADPAQLARIYAAADVFAAPSMQDNLPNTVAEALACGTPSVAFDIGGMPDLVRHQSTGWLARPFSTEDFCSGLATVLATPGWRERCRAHALELVEGSRVAAQHAAVYERMSSASYP